MTTSNAEQSPKVTGTPTSTLALVDLDGPFPVENQEVAAQTFKVLWNKRATERRDLQQRNINPDYEDFERQVKGKKLDSNLKKCTAFVRKVKHFVESQRASIQSDLGILNLTKFQSEIAAVIVEGRLKQCDICAVVGISSEIHRRYQDFSSSLLENFERVLPTKAKITKVEPSVLSKVSSDLRLFTELLLAGILPREKAIALLISTVKDMVFSDQEGVHFLIPFVHFLRGLTDSLLGQIPADVRTGLKDNGVQLKDLIRCSTLSEKDKCELKTVFSDYFQLITSNVLEKHKTLQTYVKHNRKLLQSRGEVPADRLEVQGELNDLFEKYHASASNLAYLLNLAMPHLKDLPPDPEEELEKALLTTDDGKVLAEVPGIVLFDNEETRQFYQDYPDLKVYLPPVVYRDNILEMQEKTEMQAALEKLVDKFDADVEQAELQEEEKEGADQEVTADIEGDVLPSMRDEEEDSIETNNNNKDPPQPPAKAFLTYLDNLPNCVNKNMIDRASVEFAESFNNKRNRKELVRKLFMIPRQRVDLISLYSRFVAILSRVFPAIGMDLCAMLQKDFRFLVFKKDQLKLDSKLKITRFIGELVNFSVFPKSEAFKCLKILLRHFVHHQIEMACTFLETCGRFLYRSSDSCRRMQIYIDEMMRRKAARKFEARYQYMMDNAFYHVCPPTGGGTIQRRKKTELEAFFEFILLQDLSMQTLSRADKALKMVDFDESQKFMLVTKIMSSPWKFNQNQMECSSALLAALKDYEPRVVNAVIENLTEHIRSGCDYPSDELNTFRLSTCQYLAYMYTYRVVPTCTLFNIWYYLISYGITYSMEEYTPVDPPDSLHRIRMVGHMLKICGDYFSSKGSKQRLTCFLKYFQRYFVYKRTLPYWSTRKFPFSVQEYYEDIMKRLGKLNKSKVLVAKTMEEAEKEISVMDGELREKVTAADLKTVISSQTNFVRLSESGTGRKGKDGTDGSVVAKPKLISIPEEAGIDESQAKGHPEAEVYASEETDERTIEQGLSEKELEDQEFLLTFEKMCVEAQEAVKYAVKADVSLPTVSMSRSNCDTTVDMSSVKVTLVTKKNNKQKLKTVDVPADEDFLMNLKIREEAEQLEKQKLKSRTLELTRMQKEEERRRQEEEVARKLSLGPALFFKR